MNMDSTSAEIISRMEAVRDKRRERIADLNEESSRMTDWREHVRSAPLLALAASVAAGALGAASLTGGSRRSIKSATENDTITSTKSKVAHAALSMMWSMAMPMLTRYVKQRVALALAGAAASQDNVEREEYHDRQHT
jgi:hypothetical protein